MDFGLTDEQRALDSTVRSWLADRFGPERVRAVYDDPAGDGHPRDLWQACADQGWLAITIPEQFGGLGLGLLDASVVARAFGAATVPGPWLATVVAAEAIRLAGSADQRERWLPAVASGAAVLTLATRRPGGGYDAAGAATVADDGRLTGQAVQVEYGHVADALVAASTDGRLWLVEAGTAGLSIDRVEPLDRTTRLSTVRFDGVAADPLDAGAQALAHTYRAGSVLVAHDLAGIARSALSRTVAYDQDRVQFGRPVGSFQAIKHALADLHVGVTMAEHGSLYAAYAVDSDLADADTAASIAKAKASDVGRDATAAMIQYLGGIGYTWEHDAHFAFKRAKRAEYLYGDAGWHREKLAAALVAGATDA